MPMRKAIPITRSPPFYCTNRSLADGRNSYLRLRKAEDPEAQGLSFLKEATSSSMNSSRARSRSLSVTAVSVIPSNPRVNSCVMSRRSGARTSAIGRCSS